MTSHSSSNGPVELKNVRITLGQFFAMMLAVGALISICAVGLFRLGEMEKHMLDYNELAKTAASRTDLMHVQAHADSASDAIIERVYRLDDRVRRIEKTINRKR